LNWLGLGLGLGYIDNAIEDIIIIHDASGFFWLLYGFLLFNNFRLLSSSWLFFNRFNLSMFLLAHLIIFGDMIIIIDCTSSRHLQGTYIKVHINFSNGDILEGFDSGFERGNRDANFSFSVIIPCVFK
jgi:hypothetical protein